MKVKGIFKKDIDRTINGVIKAEQRDDASISEEVNEFIVTKELSQHFDRFFSNYVDSLESRNLSEKAEKMAVWVSGFFGSGKSHFIKALYYLFSNQQVHVNGEVKDVLEIFQEKISDALLIGNMKKAVSGDIDAVLFNIDTKADQKKGRDAILGVFLNVLNELENYSSDHPHIAHMERYLDRKGKFLDFQETYRKLSGKEWVEDRPNYHFNQDEIVESLSRVLGQSKESCNRWFNSAESDFSMTVENFSEWTKEYLDKNGTQKRLIFLVDEIGQFIGQDGHLMLNLQTIVENLGVVCQGRVWVVVTSQEDIDKVLGSLSNARSMDFSKITGRFKLRLSLSSANTDEVIQKRLLEKKEHAKEPLKNFYQPNADILKNQLSFSHAGMPLLPFQSDQDFIKNYPFIPYQFNLLQKIFEVIRRVGATGLHLARGERSMLNAFQDAAEKVSGESIGILVPLYDFYPSIENFLDTPVEWSIKKAKENPTLGEFDVNILQVLFMIRYVDEIKATIDNLVTLCIDHIDTNRLEIKEKIEKSLSKLENNTLISRSGDHYYFLTNEEQDISREIKSIQIDPGDESDLIGKIIYDDINKQNKKHRYSKTGKDFEYNRLCDKYSIGGRIEKGLVISIISPFFEEYEYYGREKCIAESSNDGGYILIKLSENERLVTEVREFLKTEKYIMQKNVGNPEVNRILDDRKGENRERRGRITNLLKDMLQEANFYIAGQTFDPETQDPYSSFIKAFDYLIDNTFPKMKYIEFPSQNPQQEIQSVLRRDDLAEMSFDFEVPENNPDAIREIKNHIELLSSQSRQMVLDELIRERFSNRPYGWYEWQTLLLLVKLYLAGNINFVLNNEVLDRTHIYENISRTSNWKKITLRQRKKIEPAKIEAARRIGQQLFAEMGPDKEDTLIDFLKNKLFSWQRSLQKYDEWGERSNYPGNTEVKFGLNLISQLLSPRDNFSFIETFTEKSQELIDFASHYHEIKHFFEYQTNLWDSLKNLKSTIEINRYELENVEEIQEDLKRVYEILGASSPFSMIREIASLLNKITSINDKILTSKKDELKRVVEECLEELATETNKINAAADEIENSKEAIQSILKNAPDEKSAANLEVYKGKVRDTLNAELLRLRKTVQPIDPDKPEEIKETEQINLSSYLKKEYIETEEDVSDFIERIKSRLTNLIKEGKRIIIR